MGDVSEVIKIDNDKLPASIRKPKDEVYRFITENLRLIVRIVEKLEGDSRNKFEQDVKVSETKKKYLKEFSTPEPENLASSVQELAVSNKIKSVKKSVEEVYILPYKKELERAQRYIETKGKGYKVDFSNIETNKVDMSMLYAYLKELYLGGNKKMMSIRDKYSDFFAKTPDSFIELLSMCDIPQNKKHELQKIINNKIEENISRRSFHGPKLPVDKYELLVNMLSV
ncbi:hypothetical protein CSB37_02525 [bacterium DOLZORAL124_38_8]|nr:MAG: hypothetical protein CSB37_02525 [bacterium DOLZORAL124_38_8]